MGIQVPPHYQELANKLGKTDKFLQVSARDKETYLYYQYH